MVKKDASCCAYHSTSGCWSFLTHTAKVHIYSYITKCLGKKKESDM